MQCKITDPDIGPRTTGLRLQLLGQPRISPAARAESRVEKRLGKLI